MTDRDLTPHAMTRSERKRMGKAMRDQIPFHSHGQWMPADNRPHPVSLLQNQDRGRIKQLLPIKYGRMMASPFAFLRGSAVVMAADLATTPVTGLQTMLCGDAHLSNFGVFATPERRLVFDINDFDEAFPGPWEWDLKRLATSAVVAGREMGLNEKRCRDMAVIVARTYRQAMKRFTKMHTLDVWYYQLNADDILRVFEQASSKKGVKAAGNMVTKARTKTPEQTIEKMTEVRDGQRFIMSNPPLLIPAREMNLQTLIDQTERVRLTEEYIKQVWAQYLSSLPDERRFLLRRFQITDAALRVGGVGSVGTRCSIVLIQGGADDEALILQLKEAGFSVLERYLPKRPYTQHAQRVVTAQRLMQAASDMFLGWNTSPVTGLDYYWRQLKDMKGSFDVNIMDRDSFQTYLAICSWSLARAHARSGDPFSISGYLGRGKTFARAVADFAITYADQTEQDYESLVKAVKSGHIAAEPGL